MKKALLVLFLFLMAFLLFGCPENQAAESIPESSEEVVSQSYEYTKVSVWDMEPYSDRLFLSAGAMQTVIDGNTYEFERSIPEKDRNAFVNAQRALFARIREQTELPVTGYTFRVLEDYPCRVSSEDRRAYLNIQTTATWEQSLTTFQMIFGEYTNYGYLYGLGHHLAQQLDWETKTYEEKPNYFAEEPLLLNLVYPCFDEAYTSHGTIRACKALAASLLAQMEEPYAGEEAFLAALKDYASAQGIDFTPTYLRFCYNGTFTPLSVRGNYLNFLFDQSFRWDSDYLLGLLEENWVREVPAMIRTFEEAEGEIGEICRIFDFAPESILPTIFSDSLSASGMGEVIEAQGLYYPSTEMIYTCSINVLSHEYIHHIYDKLATNDDDASWRTESLAYYFTREHQYQQWLRSNGATANVDFRRLTGRNLTDADAFLEYYDVRIYLDREKYNPEYWIGQRSCGPEVLSFAAYIVRNYGEDIFVKLMLNTRTALPLTGSTMEEIIDQWSDYILYEKEYSEYIQQSG